MLCEVALPVDLFCINYSVIKKGSLYCNQLPGALKQVTGALTFSNDIASVTVAHQSNSKMYAHLGKKILARENLHYVKKGREKPHLLGRPLILLV